MAPCRIQDSQQARVAQVAKLVHGLHLGFILSQILPKASSRKVLGIEGRAWACYVHADPLAICSVKLLGYHVAAKDVLVHVTGLDTGSIVLAEIADQHLTLIHDHWCRSIDCFMNCVLLTEASWTA